MDASLHLVQDISVFIVISSTLSVCVCIGVCVYVVTGVKGAGG